MRARWFLGILYSVLWCSSIFSGFIMLCCPILPLLFVHQPLYRQLTELIFAIWEMYPVVLMEVLFGTRIIVTGDEILPEPSILVMNHRTRCDWNFLWGAMFYASRRPAHRLKFVLKAPIRHVPGPGWVMQMAGFLYIHRHWEHDQGLLKRMLDYFRDLKHTYQVLIFPEGTDLTEHNIKKSNSFADSHNLEHYKRVLHPKTTGFSFLASKMRENNQLEAVYDLTVGYPGCCPQSETDVVKGIFPEQVHFFIKRYPAKSIPKDEDDLKDWLKKIWKLKEQKLYSFYNQQTFTPDTEEHLGGMHKWNVYTSNALYLALLFWTSLVLITFFLLMTSTCVQVWTAVHCIAFVLLSFSTEGIQHLEVSWFRLKEKQNQNAKQCIYSKQI